jgi:large subunit ribosomal protein L6
MSRVGRKIIPVPSAVKVKIGAQALQIEGPKGKLTTPVPPGISFKLENGELAASRENDERQQRAFHGLARALANNAIKGVTEGFSRELDIVGVGYKAEQRPYGLQLALGFSHPVKYEAPKGIKLSAPQPTSIIIEGANKEIVGQVAAELRSLRPPEPYKGKGIKYVEETIRRKVGKRA